LISILTEVTDQTLYYNPLSPFLMCIGACEGSLACSSKCNWLIQWERSLLQFTVCPWSLSKFHIFVYLFFLISIACHVILDQESYDKLEEPSDEENDMLDLAFGLTET